MIHASVHRIGLDLVSLPRVNLCRHCGTILLLLLITSVQALAQGLLKPNPELDLTTSYWPGELRRSIAAGPNASFPNAVRVEVPVAPPQFYDYGAQFFIQEAIAYQEALQLVFWCRTAGGDGSTLAVKLQRHGQDGSGTWEQVVSIPHTDWQEISIPMIAPQPLAAQSGKIVLFFGIQAQNIELAGLRLERTSPCLPFSLAIYAPQNGQGHVTTVSESGQGCFQRVATAASPSEPWGIQLTQQWDKRVNQNDSIEGSFSVRRSPGTTSAARLSLVFQLATNNWETVFDRMITVESDEWRKVRFRFNSLRAFNTSVADPAQFVINLGYNVQSLDLKDWVCDNVSATPVLDIPLIEQASAWALIPGDLNWQWICSSDSTSLLVRARTVRLPDNTWDVQLTFPCQGTVHSNDVFQGSVRVRRSPGTTGEAALMFHLQHQNWITPRDPGDPYRKLASLAVATDSSEWRTVFFAFRADESANTSTADPVQWIMDLGFGPQSIDLADLVITNLGPSAVLDSLPNDFNTYAGREPDAPWRQAALNRIEQHRKGDFILRVIDTEGKPLANCVVHARLLRHQFAFGGSVKAEDLVGPRANPNIQRVVTNWFNQVVFENDLKWGSWLSPAAKALTVQALTWLQSRNIPVRGHTLVWPIKGSPADAYANPLQLRAALDQHVTSQASDPLLLRRLVDWDVVNEPVYYGLHTDAYRALYRDSQFAHSLTNWFHLARLADAFSRRFMNEFGALDGPGGNSARVSEFRRCLRILTNADPGLLQGIGLQAHLVDRALLPPERLVGVFDEFAREFNVPIVITELDIAVDDSKLQADYTRDVLLAAYSHLNVEGVLLWIWSPGSRWRSNASLLNDDWSLRPNGQAYSNLVFHTWQTHVTNSTDSAGIASFRGFKGTYEIVTVFDEWRRTTNHLELIASDKIEVRVNAQPSTTVILRPPQISGDTLQLTAEGDSGRRYALLSATNLALPQWSAAQEQTANANGVVQFQLPFSQKQSAVFFRLEPLP